MDPLERYSDPELAALMERLTLYATYKMRKLWFRGVKYRDGMTAVKGKGPDDVAHDAVLAHLQGEETDSRRYDPSSGRTFEEFLRGTIDSMVSGFVKSAENRRVREAGNAQAGMGGVPRPDPPSTEPPTGFEWMSAESLRKLVETVHPLLNDDQQCADTRCISRACAWPPCIALATFRLPGWRRSGLVMYKAGSRDSTITG